jgi:hypothetical protein
MRTLTNQEKRTIRFGVIGVTIYLCLFGGLQAWRRLGKSRAEYQTMVAEAQTLRQEVQLYQDKVLALKKLMDESKVDPARLDRVTAVANASAAIQKAAATGGVRLGPIRESSARGSTKELASVQLGGVGTVSALLAFLHETERMGYPLIIDSMQITSEPRMPGMIKVNLTIVILDYDQWKTKKEAQNA